MTEKEKLPTLNIKRTPKEEPPPTKEPPPVTSGSLGERVLDYTYNASREKSREVTDISPLQGRILPILDVTIDAWEDIIKVATYRQNKDNYKRLYNEEKPTPTNLASQYIYRVSQWQKSINALNLNALNALTLAEMEVKPDEGEFGRHDPYAPIND